MFDILGCNMDVRSLKGIWGVFQGEGAKWDEGGGRLVEIAEVKLTRRSRIYEILLPQKYPLETFKHQKMPIQIYPPGNYCSMQHIPP